MYYVICNDVVSVYNTVKEKWRNRCLEIWAARYMYFQNMESEIMSIRE